MTLEGLCDDFRAISKWIRANNDLAPLARAPTFLIVNGDNDVIAPLAAQFILENYEGEDWGRVLALHRHFGADILGWFGAVNREMYVRRLEEARNKDEPDEVLGLIESRCGHLPEFLHAWVPTCDAVPTHSRVIRGMVRRGSEAGALQGSPVWLQGSVGEGCGLAEEDASRSTRWAKVEGFLSRFGLQWSLPCHEAQMQPEEDHEVTRPPAEPPK